jgi:hypothetical protein
VSQPTRQALAVLAGTAAPIEELGLAAAVDPAIAGPARRLESDPLGRRADFR